MTCAGPMGAGGAGNSAIKSGRGSRVDHEKEWSAVCGGRGRDLKGRKTRYSTRARSLAQTWYPVLLVRIQHSTSLKLAFSGFWSSMPHSQKTLEPNSSEFHCGKGILRDKRLQGAIFNLIQLPTLAQAANAKSARRKLLKRGCFCF